MKSRLTSSMKFKRAPPIQSSQLQTVVFLFMTSFLSWVHLLTGWLIVCVVAVRGICEIKVRPACYNYTSQWHNYYFYSVHIVIEIKTIAESVDDSGFCLEKSSSPDDGSNRLKKNHSYYYQVYIIIIGIFFFKVHHNCMTSIIHAGSMPVVLF